MEREKLFSPFFPGFEGNPKLQRATPLLSEDTILFEEIETYVATSLAAVYTTPFLHKQKFVFCMFLQFDII